jgi:hypothetical protein
MAKATACTARRSACRPSGSPTKSRRCATKWPARDGAVSRSAAAVRNQQPGNVLRIFERGGRFRPEVGIPERLEEPGRPRERGSANRGLGTENRTDPVSSACKRRGCSIRRSTSWARTIIRATIAAAAAPPAMWSMPTTARPVTPGRMPSSATWAWPRASPTTVKNSSIRRFPRRAGASDRASFTTARSDQPVHRLPHSPRHQRAQQLSRLHVVGQRNRRRADVSAEQKHPTAEEYASRRCQSRRRPPPRELVRSEFLANAYGPESPATRHTQFADFHGHGWVFRAVFKKDRQGTCSIIAGDDRRQVTTEKFRRPCAKPTDPRNALQASSATTRRST